MFLVAGDPEINPLNQVVDFSSTAVATPVSYTHLTLPTICSV